jgi:hypothetical protein
MFLAALGIGFYARRAGAGAETPQQADAHAADLAAIRKTPQSRPCVHVAARPGAPNTLWPHDAVKLDVPGPPVVGMKALGEMSAKFPGRLSRLQGVAIRSDIKEVQIADGGALEVGDFAATDRMSAKDNPVSVSDKGMRFLRRQSDGSRKLGLVGMK